MGARNTHFGQHDREWRQRIWQIKFLRRSCRRSCGKESAKEEYTDDDAHEGILISDESDSNDHDSDTESESIISTTEVEILNDDKSVTLISKEEGADMFPEGAKFVQDNNDVVEMSPEEKDH